MTQAHAGGHGAQGRPISWLSVLVICIGFSVGGLGLCLNPTWWMFWTGCGITAVGCVLAAACNIMEDYSTEDH